MGLREAKLSIKRLILKVELKIGLERRFDYIEDKNVLQKSKQAKFLAISYFLKKINHSKTILNIFVS